MLNKSIKSKKISHPGILAGEGVLKRAAAVMLALALAFTFTSCGSDNFTSDGTETPEVQDQEISEDAYEDGQQVEIPASDDEEVRQIVTVKAGADGTPESAKLKSSDDDIETEVDKEKLPFGVKVTYYLEGEEVSPEEIAGATGNVKMRFDYENKTSVKVNVDGEYVETQVPLAFVTLVTAADDVLYNVEVNSGDVTEMSGNRIIYGYALPGISDGLKLDAAKNKLKAVGDSLKDDETAETEDEEDDEGLPEYVEISGFAVNFKLDFTATMVTNGLFKDIKKNDLKDLSKSLRDLAEFSDAGDELVDGVGKLKTGASKFGDGLEKYVDGADKLNDGAKALAKGAGELAEGITELDKGAGTLSDGAEALDDNSEALKTGVSELKKGLEELNKALEDAGITGSSEAAADEDPADDDPADEDPTDDDPAGDDAESEDSAETGEISEEVADTEISDGSVSQPEISPELQQLMAVKDSLEVLAAGAAQLAEGLDAYTSGVGQLSDGASKLAEGVSKLSEGAGQLSEGASKLSEGTGALASSGSKLVSGYDALEDGIGELKKGLSELNDEIFQQIGSLSTGALPETIDSLKAMRLADCGFTAWDTYDGKEGSIMFILETEEIQ